MTLKCRLFNRDSIYVAESQILQSIASKFNELRTIWDWVGMSEEQRHERMNTAVMHLETLLSEMVQEEQDMMTTVKESVTHLERTVQILCKELNASVPEVTFL